MSWQNVTNQQPRSFVCAWCQKLVASSLGYLGTAIPNTFIYICPNCHKPTYFETDKQIPGVAPGADVAYLPADVQSLYTETRQCVAAIAYTSAVLSCRKLLMHIAVAQGATAG